MPKIKSIKLKMPLLGSQAGDSLMRIDIESELPTLEPRQGNDTFWGIPNKWHVAEKNIIQAHQVFEIEYEKPTLLKRPDGSLISEPEINSKNIKIGLVIYQFGYTVYPEIYHGTPCELASLMNGDIFLLEDQHLAEKKAKMLSKQLEIQYEIDRLNAEEGWVADLQRNSQTKYFLDLDKNNVVTFFFIGEGRCQPNRQAVLMSTLVCTRIIKKYSQEELKQYLGIII